MVVAGDFPPVLAKHSKSFLLIDCISVDVDRMQGASRAHGEAGRRLHAINLVPGCHDGKPHVSETGRGDCPR